MEYFDDALTLENCLESQREWINLGQVKYVAMVAETNLYGMKKFGIVLGLEIRVVGAKSLHSRRQ